MQTYLDNNPSNVVYQLCCCSILMQHTVTHPTARINRNLAQSRPLYDTNQGSAIQLLSIRVCPHMCAHIVTISWRTLSHPSTHTRQAARGDNGGRMFAPVIEYNAVLHARVYVCERAPAQELVNASTHDGTLCLNYTIHIYTSAHIK